MNFTQVFIPRQLPCLRLTGQPGGGPQRTRAYSQSLREGPPADHSRPHLGGQLPVLFSYVGDNPQGSLKPHIFMEGGRDQEPLGSAAFGSPSFLIPLVPTWKRKQAGTVLGQHDLIRTLQTPMIQHKEAQLSPKAGPPSPGTPGRGDRRHGALLAVQREKEQTGRSYLIQGPTSGPARPFSCFCTSSGENGDDR